MRDTNHDGVSQSSRPCNGATMSTACLKHSLRNYGGPTMFLTIVCVVLGAVFLTVGASMGGVFIVAGLVALLVFILIGAREYEFEGRKP